jgi:hypothetical protein
MTGARLLPGAAACALALLAGCTYRLPPRPLQLSATDPDGKSLTAEALRGKPYVISLWLPG